MICGLDSKCLCCCHFFLCLSKELKTLFKWTEIQTSAAQIGLVCLFRAKKDFFFFMCQTFLGNKEYNFVDFIFYSNSKMKEIFPLKMLYFI